MILSIDYGLSPEFSMKSKVNDIMKCYEYLLNEMGLKSQNIFVFGESAGGGLSLLFIQELLTKPDEKMCGGCVMYSPWCNIAGNTSSYTDNKDIDAMIAFDADCFTKNGFILYG